MALNNISPKIKFEELEKKIERDFCTNKVQSKITDFFLNNNWIIIKK